ncbi:MAG: type II toxin-antitoxin system death-on-curing family toxin [Anaerolineales bacterium]
MAQTGGEIVYPTLVQVIHVNERMIDEFGGMYVPPDNCRNRDSLEYILDAIGASVYGQELFPTLKEKASALTFEIISAHVFVDGCKRTGMWIAYEFLVANGVRVFYDETAIDIAVAMSSATATRDDFLCWLHEHQNS